MHGEELFLIIMTLTVFAGLAILYMAMSNRRAWREMEHRERLAMIQRGLIPSPEADPLGFETAVEVPPGNRVTARAQRWRSAGVMTIGIGLALMLLLTFTAGEPGVGMGVGGAFAVLGATLLFNGMQMSSSEDARQPFYPPRTRPVQPGPPPAQPPSEP